MLTVQFRAMGCQMAAFLDADTRPAALALQEVPFWFEEWEQALSRFRTDSELSLLNARAGQAVPVSEILWQVLQAALAAAQRSGGLVTPTILPALERAGYDRNFEQLQPGGIAPEREIHLRPAAWQSVQLDERNRTVRLPYSARLDFGGVAKGWAAQQAMLRLSAFGPALVNAGGDLAASGLDAAGQPWPVEIADPLGVQPGLGMLLLDGCGVATSGIDYRRWRGEDGWKHHIIDPRSGEPAATDLVSVTVVAPDVIRAETAAKAALILGSQAGMNWIEEQPDYAALLALPDGQLLYSSRMMEYLWSEYVAYSETK